MHREGARITRTLRTLISRQFLERVAGDAVDAPLIHRQRAEAAVEADGGLIPVQDGPFDAAAVALDRDLGDAREQRAPVAMAAQLGPDVEVFEIHARTA